MKKVEKPAPSLGTRTLLLVLFSILKGVEMLVEWALRHIEDKIKDKSKDKDDDSE